MVASMSLRYRAAVRAAHLAPARYPGGRAQKRARDLTL
jgi:hypothetical protein